MKQRKTKQRPSTPKKSRSTVPPSAPERIQKVLARYGVNSRRRIDKLIEEGRVRVNGKVAKLGDRITIRDKVAIDGRELHLPKEETLVRQTLIYHKPEGEVCTRRDPEGRRTVFQALPKIENARWIAVGRLDINTSGLLLFTNDGDFARDLMHPSHEVEREYAVRVYGNVDSQILMNLQRGVLIDGERAAFDSIRFAGGEGRNRWYHVVLREGKNREVRKLWEAEGVQVSRLIRVRYGNIHLPADCRVGCWQYLAEKEQNQLAQLICNNFKET